jgi:hypothetical protein
MALVSVALAAAVATYFSLTGAPTFARSDTVS